MVKNFKDEAATAKPSHSSGHASEVAEIISYHGQSWLCGFEFLA